MKLTALHTIAPIFQTGPELELEAVIDGNRRDVLIRRPGFEDFLVWQENIAGCPVSGEAGEVPAGPPAETGAWECACSRRFNSERALKTHQQRSHAGTLP
jgi:hypothetical protein